MELYLIITSTKEKLIIITSMEEKLIIIIKLSLKKKKKKTSGLHFYYKLVLWSLGKLGRGCCGGGWTFTLEVLLGRNRESC